MKQSFISLRLIFALFLMLLAGCSSTDPLEGYNRVMYKANKTVDQFTLKPAAKAYKKITHNAIENRISNFFSNLSELSTFVNSLLQGEFRNAAISSSRIVWNTTLGLGGLFDVATSFNLYSNPEDFGQTLRKWGVSEGPYVVLPLLGPSTVTDTLGFYLDATYSPLQSYQFSDHKVRESFNILNVLDSRSRLLGLDAMIQSASVDEYSFVRNAYLQKRASLVRNGAADQSIEDDFDALFEEQERETIKNQN